MRTPTPAARTATRYARTATVRERLAFELRPVLLSLLASLTFLPLVVALPASAHPQHMNAHAYQSSPHAHSPTPARANARHDWDDEWDDDWDDDWGNDGGAGPSSPADCEEDWLNNLADAFDPARPDCEGTSDGTNTTPPTESGDDTDLGVRNNARTVGIASVNINRYMGVPNIDHDRRAMLLRKDVDIIGWQEADPNPHFFDRYRSKGWGTINNTKTAGVAFSWKRKTFEFVNNRMRRLHGAHHGSPTTTWRARYAQILTLRHRKTGQKMVFVNAHILPYIEDLTNPGTPRDNLNARVATKAISKVAKVFSKSRNATVIGTGDFNWDYLGDSQQRSPNFVLGQVGRYAQSSYEQLGTTGLIPTLGNRRFVDYVFLGRNSPAKFVSHASLSGFRSDHRPLIAKVRLTR